LPTDAPKAIAVETTASNATAIGRRKACGSGNFIGKLIVPEGATLEGSSLLFIQQGPR
jgi:hypothetical protein